MFYQYVIILINDFFERKVTTNRKVIVVSILGFPCGSSLFLNKIQKFNNLLLNIYKI